MQKAVSKQIIIERRLRDESSNNSVGNINLSVLYAKIEGALKGLGR